jgi:hypothetical protein
MISDISSRARQILLRLRANCCVVLVVTESTAMMDILGVVLMIVGAGLVFSHLDVTIGSSSND